MDINRLTEKSQQALSAAQTVAARYSHQQVDDVHLLAALLEQERGLATAILNKTGVAVDGLQRRVVQELDRLPKVTGPGGSARPDLHYGSSESAAGASGRRG
jgi:ATP-dependent Clp protease ATP-binding subunit ClpB